MLRLPIWLWLLIAGDSLFTLTLSDVGSVMDEAQKNLSKIKSNEMKNMKLPPCRLCRTLVDSFKKGMDKTANSNFQGGDTAWEEEKRLVYARSEVRFVEIQENLCSDVELGQSQCQSTAEDIEHYLERWWKEEQGTDLYQWLCINTLKYCCPENHYGPNCLPCPGFPDSVCNGNGKCKGNGTRKGNGECSCDSGYRGAFCDECASTYYESYRDDTKLLCSKCHAACYGDCTKAGHKGCLECNDGWMFDSDRGCLDVNECLIEDGPCSEDEFCINNEGSFTCLVCDHACEGCTGDGPDMCNSCARGFVMKDGLCVERPGWDGIGTSETTRYLTYLGLCIATFIIFQKNTMVASFIGLLVAMYMVCSEYMLDTEFMSTFYSSLSTM